MIDAGLEGDNRRLEGIFRWEVDTQAEDAAVEGTVFGSEDHGFPAEQVIGIDGAGGTIGGRVAEDFLIFALETAEGHCGVCLCVLRGLVVWAGWGGQVLVG